MHATLSKFLHACNKVKHVLHINNIASYPRAAGPRAWAYSKSIPVISDASYTPHQTNQKIVNPQLKLYPLIRVINILVKL